MNSIGPMNFFRTTDTTDTTDTTIWKPGFRKEIKLKNRDPIANIHTIIIIAFLTLIGY